MGMYSSILSTAGTIAGFGLGSSGVRQIADALGRDEAREVFVVRKVLRYASLATGLLGGLLLWTFREPLAVWFMGDPGEASSLKWLGIGLLLVSISGAQTALLQGYRRVGDLAFVNIIGSVLASLLALGFVYLMGRDGVVFFVMAYPAATVMVACYYSYRLPHGSVYPRWTEARRELAALLGLGIVFMSSGLAHSGTMLAVRTLLTRELGMNAVGQFQATWTISMQYVGFVLGAMSADYYPRLTAVIHDREQRTRLVNEQTEVALLLAGPMILAMIAFSPLLINLLYSNGFNEAANMMRWQALGDLIKIFSTPLGYMLLAHGDGKAYLITELFWNACFFGLIWFGLPLYGLSIMGAGFLATYFLYYLFIFIVIKWKVGFCWTKSNIFLALSISCMAGMVFVASSLKYIESGGAPGFLKFTEIQELANIEAWIIERFDPVCAFFCGGDNLLQYVGSGLAAMLTFCMTCYCFFRLNRLLQFKDWLHRKLHKVR